MRLALAQINSTVGDLAGNATKIKISMKEAERKSADLIIFPELALTGYPPEDLLLKPQFVTDNLACLDDIIASTRGQRSVTIIGFVDRQEDIYNAAAVIHNGELKAVYHKVYLPNYGVFDEKRYFQSGTSGLVCRLGETKIGVSICEDIWYPAGPAVWEALEADAHLLVNLSASPYSMGKVKQREQMLAVRAADSAAYLAYVNLVGGQDELVFDGGSLIVDPQGRLVAHARQFAEDLLLWDLDLENVFAARLRDIRRREEKLKIAAPRVAAINIPFAPTSSPEPLPVHPYEPLEETAEVYAALTRGLQDYVRKNGFERVFIGLSGGIDSSLTACLAADALEPVHVTGVSMPFTYTSSASRADARQLAQNLGISFYEIPIEPVFKAFQEILTPVWAGKDPDTTEENLQARIRGMLLMALANKFNGLVLTTGNKSEMSTGYATLYGDMAGGLAVIKDVPKTLVYRLAYYRNQLAGTEVIPHRVLEREPTAELRPGQKDTDTLPPYEILDPIIQAYVEEDTSGREIARRGVAPSVLEDVIQRIDRSEYKRRQAPPGIKVTARAFGKDRRFPITNRYRG